MIFMDLHKSYYSLVKSRCLYVLDGYGVRSRDLHLLGEAEDGGTGGGYYGEPFHRYRGVTQGDQLLPTIFNVVVDAVICHW